MKSGVKLRRTHFSRGPTTQCVPLNIEMHDGIDEINALNNDSIEQANSKSNKAAFEEPQTPEKRSKVCPRTYGEKIVFTNILKIA